MFFGFENLQKHRQKNQELRIQNTRYLKIPYKNTELYSI